MNKTTELVSKLPNLSFLNLESCNYFLTKQNVGRGVPSPSDLKWEIRGVAKVEQESFRLLKNGYDWRAIDRKDVPPRLLEMLPNGKYMFSDKINKSFNDNPTFAHGFVVVVLNNDQEIFFLVNDMDHPL